MDSEAVGEEGFRGRGNAAVGADGIGRKTGLCEFGDDQDLAVDNVRDVRVDEGGSIAVLAVGGGRVGMSERVCGGRVIAVLTEINALEVVLAGGLEEECCIMMSVPDRRQEQEREDHTGESFIKHFGGAKTLFRGMAQTSRCHGAGYVVNTSRDKVGWWSAGRRPRKRGRDDRMPEACATRSAKNRRRSPACALSASGIASGRQAPSAPPSFYKSSFSARQPDISGRSLIYPLQHGLIQAPERCLPGIRIPSRLCGILLCS